MIQNAIKQALLPLGTLVVTVLLFDQRNHRILTSILLETLVLYQNNYWSEILHLICRDINNPA